MPIPLLINYSKANSSGMLTKLVFNVMNNKAIRIYSIISPFLVGKKIVDIGSGSGSISSMLVNRGYKVTSIDVEDLNIYPNVKVTKYDGFIIPLPNKTVDTAIIIHVLHHCADKEKVLKEAMRVAKRVILIEDTYSHWYDWVSLQIQDALTNFEFRLHDFETVVGWRKIIKKNKWKIISEKMWSETLKTSIYSKYIMFVIE